MFPIHDSVLDDSLAVYLHLSFLLMSRTNSILLESWKTVTGTCSLPPIFYYLGQRRAGSGSLIQHLSDHQILIECLAHVKIGSLKQFPGKVNQARSQQRLSLSQVL